VSLIYSPPFKGWLEQLPTPAATAVRAGLTYLERHGRGAQLDDVRHRIQISRHYPDMSEVRVLHRHIDTDLVIRVLTVFADNDRNIVVCVGGDKAAWHRTQQTDWYDTFVAVADTVFDHYLSWRTTNDDIT
jgi:hypothetical protein